MDILTVSLLIAVPSFIFFMVGYILGGINIPKLEKEIDEHVALVRRCQTHISVLLGGIDRLMHKLRALEQEGRPVIDTSSVILDLYGLLHTYASEKRDAK